MISISLRSLRRVVGDISRWLWGDSKFPLITIVLLPFALIPPVMIAAGLAPLAIRGFWCAAAYTPMALLSIMSPLFGWIVVLALARRRCGDETDSAQRYRRVRWYAYGAGFWAFPLLILVATPIVTKALQTGGIECAVMTIGFRLIPNFAPAETIPAGHTRAHQPNFFGCRKTEHSR